MPSSGAVQAFIFALLICAGLAESKCECGYLDPVTDELWTDRIITYWNETASAQADLITNPTVSPAWQGQGIAGDTGTQNENWVVASAPINNWEDGFSSTYRTGYAKENVRLVNDTKFQGLALDVSPAFRKNHTTWGSAVVSRRRDILYGSFRTMTQAPNIQYGGSAFDMQARFNESELIDIGVYGADFNANYSTLRWAFSASDAPAKPVITNLTYLGEDGFGFIEHRFDWSRIPGITFSNSARTLNTSATQSKLYDGGVDHHVPTTPSVFSYRHYATGESSQSAGPPMGGTSTSKIIYSRIFLNSSNPARWKQFESQCFAAPFSSLCSTEDYTLRGSTAFNRTALNEYVIPPTPFKPKTWSIASICTCLGASLLLYINAYARRMYTRRQKLKAYYSAQEKERSEMTFNDRMHAMDDYTPREEMLDLRSLGNSFDSGNSAEREFEMAFSQWNTEIMLENHSEAGDEDDDDDDRDSDWSNEEYESEDDTKGAKDGNDAEKEDGIKEKHALKQPLPLLTVPTLLDPNIGEGGSSTSLVSAPVIKRWRRRKVATTDKDEPSTVTATLAAPRDGEEMPPVEKPSVREMLARARTWLHDSIFIDESALGTTASGQSKVAYLGSLRGFATLAITIGHWSAMYMETPSSARLALDPTTPLHYPKWFVYGWIVSLSLLFQGSASFRVAMFFVLPARIMSIRYLTRGDLLNVAESSLRRLPRILFPVFMAAFFEYFLIEVSAFRWISRLPSRSWTVWSYYVDYGNLFEFFNSFISLWFTVPPTQPAIVQRYAIGIMWTVALMIQLTWSLFLCAIIARQIKNHYKRWTFYSLCIFFNWYANRLDTLFLLGLMVADLDCKLNYKAWAKRGLPLTPASINRRFAFLKKVRLPGQIFAWAIFFVGFGLAWCETTGYGPYSWPTRELRLRVDFVTGNPKGWGNSDLQLNYDDLKFTCILPVLSFYLLCDLNKIFAKAFSLKIFMVIGDHSFGIYLLHGAVFWSWGAYIFIKLLTVGLPYWAANLVALGTSYMLLAVMAVIFTNTVDKWSQWLSTAFWRSVSRGYGRRHGK
ncbi:hypothetical protein CBS101457_002423 [Exobasidium rhododendri]|nr:hypothetical protein CBS101457_002423 [Exobasidium rhododendri]